MGSEDERTMFSRRFLLKALLTGHHRTISGVPPCRSRSPEREEAAEPSTATSPFRAKPPPRRGSVWVPGYWEWSHRRRDYVWVPGRWIPARPGFRYRQPRWTNRNGSWFFIEGGWVR